MNEEQFCVVKAKHGDLEERECKACDCLAKMKPIINKSLLLKNTPSPCCGQLKSHT